MFIKMLNTMFCAIPMMCLADVSPLRSVLDQYVNSVKKASMRVETIRNVGVADAGGQAYLELCGAVSNSADVVFRDLPSVTTNAAERLVLMSTAWRYDEDYYLHIYSLLAEMALSNRVSKAELEWYGLPERNDLTNCIRCRYREPAVANLALRISQVTGDTNFYQTIISGAAYTNYLEEVSAGLW